MNVRKGNPAEKRKKGTITNELWPLHCDHGEGSTPLRVKKDVAH
jgi:hypothetical protein